MNDAKRTSLFLMANLGAEVSRIISAKEKSDSTLMQGALERAERILDEIKGLPDIQPRIAEIEMLSHAIRSLASPTQDLQVAHQNIKSYFMPFALRVMSI